MKNVHYFFVLVQGKYFFNSFILSFFLSNRAYPPKQAFATTLDLPPKRDIAAFMYFELLGASPGLSNIEHSKTKLEIAVAGTALPVILSLDPTTLQFPTTYIGQKNEKNIYIYNQSDHKSIDFRFPSISNFAIQPASGKLKPREKLKILVTFIPHQMGLFISFFFHYFSRTNYFFRLYF